jgi:hypothetical protein
MTIMSTYLMLAEGGSTTRLRTGTRHQRQTNTEPCAVAPGLWFTEVSLRCTTNTEPCAVAPGLWFAEANLPCTTNTEPCAVAPGMWFTEVSLTCTTQFKRFLIVIVERPGKHPVATAPGSVFVDLRHQTFCLRDKLTGTHQDQKLVGLLNYAMSPM